MKPVIPLSLQGVLWSRQVTRFKVQRDAPYIIHQVLSCGTWNHVRWLFDTYGRDEIKNVFLHCPAKNYTKKSFHFFGTIVLGITPDSVNIKNYVRTFPRIIE